MFKRKSAKDLAVENRVLSKKLKSRNTLLKLKKKNKELKQETTILGRVTKNLKANIKKNQERNLKSRKTEFKPYNPWIDNDSSKKKDKTRNVWFD